MRHFLAVMLLFFGVTVTPALADSVLSITQGSTKAISVKRPMGEVILDNPAIADINLISRTSLRIRGKQSGYTHLTVVSRDGDVLFDREILVQPDDRALVSLYRPGAAPTNYFCTSSCSVVQGGAAGLLSQGLQIAEQYANEGEQEDAKRGVDGQLDNGQATFTNPNGLNQ